MEGDDPMSRTSRAVAHTVGECANIGCLVGSLIALAVVSESRVRASSTCALMSVPAITVNVLIPVLRRNALVSPELSSRCAILSHAFTALLIPTILGMQHGGFGFDSQFSLYFAVLFAHVTSWQTPNNDGLVMTALCFCQLAGLFLGHYFERLPAVHLAYGTFFARQVFLLLLFSKVVHMLVTWQRLLVTELEASLQAATAALKAKQAFLVNMDHEVHTPLY